MSHKLSFFARRGGLIGALIPSLCLLLSACGGGGGGGGSGVASLPPPPVTPTPTPTPPPQSIVVQTTWLDTVGTRNGAYDLLGRLTLTPGNGGLTSHRSTAPGEFSVTVAKPGDAFRYTLNAPAGIMPGGVTSISVSSPSNSWDFNLPPAPSFSYNNSYGDYCCQSFGQRLTASLKDAAGNTAAPFLTFDFTRGSASSLQPLGSGMQLSSTLDYDIGFSYVAMGEWSWRVVDMNGTAAGDFGSLLFVNGDRTPAAGIPVSGTATYDAHTLALKSSSLTPGIPFTLTADFGQRTISTSIDQDYRYDPQGDVLDYPAPGIHVAGSAPFSNNGAFDISLSGTANYSGGYPLNTPQTPASQPVTGDMAGAFFGPHAEQVGGTFALERANGTLLLQDAFVGQRPIP
jgi:hypothetical protein